MNRNTEEMLAEEPVLEKGFEFLDEGLVEKDPPFFEQPTMAPPAPERQFEEPVLEKGFEFLDNGPVEKPMGAQASIVIVNLTSMLVPFVKTNKLGRVFDAEGAYQIFAANPRKTCKPDASFVARGRFPNEAVPPGYIRIPPDLVIEGISPNDLTTDTEERIADFLGAGTRLLWIVHPTTRAIWVFRQDGSAARLTETQSLSGEDVIPGFSIPIATLFADL